MQYRTSIFTSEELQLRVQVATQSGDPALYVVEGQRTVGGTTRYSYFSDALGESNEVVVLLVPASSSARTRARSSAPS